MSIWLQILMGKGLIASISECMFQKIVLKKMKIYDSMNHIGFIHVTGVFSYDASYGSAYYYSLKGDYTKGFYLEKTD